MQLICGGLLLIVTDFFLNFLILYTMQTSHLQLFHLCNIIQYTGYLLLFAFVLYNFNITLIFDHGIRAIGIIITYD